MNEVPNNLKDRRTLLMVNVLSILGAPQKLISLIKIMENVAKFERDLNRVGKQIFQRRCPLPSGTTFTRFFFLPALLTAKGGIYRDVSHYD